jgi:predicted adenylyl cyclase CyaB
MSLASEKNFEIKARLTGTIKDAEERIKRLIFSRVGYSVEYPTHRILKQNDIYFETTDGSRLKVRNEIEQPEIGVREIDVLVSPHKTYANRYVRTDEATERTSAYTRYFMDNFSAFKETFIDSGALKTLVTVTKTRILWLFKNVRIHLDSVEGLEGAFVEIEIVIRNETEESESKDLMTLLLGALEINEEDKLATSYSDMLLSPDNVLQIK